MFGGLLFAALLVLAIDSASDWLSGPRRLLSLALLPVYVLADAPARFGRFVDDSASSRTHLLDERAQLRGEVERLNLEMQRLAVLESENARLRMLLESKRRLALKVRAAEIIGVIPNPSTRQVVIDKGSSDGAYIGQPVVDADGVVGQVVDVTPVSSRVMLITDAAHAIPATVVRSGFRVVAVGIGEPDMLEVRHVTESGDIAEGDLLITSGLDQRFPAGYPIARIVSVSRDAGGAFVLVRAVPLAKLERESHVLLVFTPPARPLSPRAREDATDFALPAGQLPVPAPAPVPPAAAGMPAARVGGVSAPTAMPFAPTPSTRTTPAVPAAPSASSARPAVPAAQAVATPDAGAAGVAAVEEEAVDEEALDEEAVEEDNVVSELEPMPATRSVTPMPTPALPASR